MTREVVSKQYRKTRFRSQQQYIINSFSRLLLSARNLVNLITSGDLCGRVLRGGEMAFNILQLNINY